MTRLAASLYFKIAASFLWPDVTNIRSTNATGTNRLTFSSVALSLTGTAMPSLRISAGAFITFTNGRRSTRTAITSTFAVNLGIGEKICLIC